MASAKMVLIGSEVAVAAAPRRVGAETSKTRDALLDSVEKLMLEDGYASVSYRALAAKAGVTPSLVQYYFPSLDDIFLGAIQRYSERNLALLAELLEARSLDRDLVHARQELQKLVVPRSARFASLRLSGSGVH